MLLVDEVIKLVAIVFSVILNTEPIFIWTKMVFLVAFEVFSFPIEELLLKSILHVVSVKIMKPTWNIIHSAQQSKYIDVFHFKWNWFFWYGIIDNDMLLVHPFIVTQICLVYLNSLLGIPILHIALKGNATNEEA